MHFSTQYDLYFGRDFSRVGYVLDLDFEAFLADHVTQRFPGFTILKGKGFWKGEREDIFILRILGDDVDGFGVSKIAAAYRDAFKQESVLIVQTAVNGSLV